ncbi:MAG: tRNA glutamyl-Q(34) synthetase GluQRS [Verrucomicrobiota bacterium]
MGEAGVEGVEVTRFAPSPTGYLHLGHVYSARVARDAAREGGGRFLLRMEDIDPGRCRPEFEEAIYEDLGWLGFEWEEPVRRQSEHMDDYGEALARLEGMGLLYPCFCTRREIAEEIARAGAAPHGPEGPLYPGICRGMSVGEREERMGRGEEYAMRLDVGRAMEVAGDLEWVDLERGVIRARPELLGDVVLARKDVGTSYHLAVTVDDAIQGVGLVTRGEDLLEATHVHRLLIALLELPVPEWRHHRLLTGADGKRYAKRDGGVTVRGMRERGMGVEEVWGQLP